MKPTVYAPSLTPVWKLLRECGYDPDPLFREMHIDPESLRDERARISLSRIEQMWKWIDQHSDNRCIGLGVVEHWHPTAAGALGYAWLASSTLRTSLERLVRYQRMISEGVTGSIHEKAGEVSLVVAFHLETEEEIPVWVDAILALIVHLCRINYGEELPLTSVSFRHREPDCASRFYGYFRCPLEFGADDNRISFPAAILDQPLEGSHPTLARLHDQVIVDYLAGLKQGSLVEKVKNAIIERLPSGGVTDATIAHALYMHERTLQRNLRQEGTTFKSILNEVREELAIRYLQDETLSLGEISFLLGFTEISSFSRAFKRWTGVPPSDYRAGR